MHTSEFKALWGEPKERTLSTIDAFVCDVVHVQDLCVDLCDAVTCKTCVYTKITQTLFG